MPRVELTSHLARHTSSPPETVEGGTVSEVLAAYFAKHPAVRAYVLDEQGALRKHVVVFVGDAQARSLAEPVGRDQILFVMQALSGG